MKHQTQLQEMPKPQKHESIPYESLIQTKEFKELIKKKRSFIIPTTIFFLIFYFSLPLLAAYSKILHTQLVGPITSAWIYATLQFLLVWICGFIYVKKSEKYDNSSQEILQMYRKELSE